jgi:hypothetical protein
MGHSFPGPTLPPLRNGIKYEFRGMRDVGKIEGVGVEGERGQEIVVFTTWRVSRETKAHGSESGGHQRLRDLITRIPASKEAFRERE